MNQPNDTIAAQATPPGRGGVGIIRLSGLHTKVIAQKILGKVPVARRAEFFQFKDHDHTIIDEGLALFFPSPHSFTGEDVLELHGHGGPVVMDSLLRCVLQHGTRLAKPGEFSERAFLNNKIDLIQAEAIADLIDAGSSAAARSAVRSLQGDFSKCVHELVDALINLRKMVEAAIDFPEEEIDFLEEYDVKKSVQTIINQVKQVEASAKQGALLQEGMTVVIAGKPNVGKSSLLNQLCGKESAIVTDIAGTTRDTLREYVNIDGMPLHFIDTAGLRETDDIVEKEGVRRAWKAIEKADRVLLVTDASKPPEGTEMTFGKIPITIIRNKIDLVSEPVIPSESPTPVALSLSAKTGEGIALLKDHLKKCMGYDQTQEGAFIARRRHLDAIARAKTLLEKGFNELTAHRAGELLAEDLRLAQNTLSEITGEFTSDDLLGEIFSSFCIGK